jgi:hypothetical protein
MLSGCVNALAMSRTSALRALHAGALNTGACSRATLSMSTRAPSAMLPNEGNSNPLDDAHSFVDCVSDYFDTAAQLTEHADPVLREIKVFPCVPAL